MHGPCFSFIWTILDIDSRTGWNRAWSFVLTVCLYGKPSLSSPGTDTRGGGWVPWARLVLGSLSLCLHWASEMPQHLDPRGKGCRQCSHPWAEGSPPTILCPWPGAQRLTIPASHGLLKIELPKQCVCGLACVSWDPLTGYPTPSFWGWVSGEIFPLVSSAFSASLFPWYPADMELLVMSCGDQQKPSYI